MYNNLSLGKDPLPMICKDYQSAIMSVYQSLTRYTTLSDIVCGIYYVGNKKMTSIHQRRISKAKKHNAFEAIKKCKIDGKSFSDFDVLFEYIYTVLLKTQVIQNRCLWVYDVAIRIGRKSNPVILPTNEVYLFRGAQEGACKLLKQSRLPYKVDKSIFPSPLCLMDSIEIENLLCIYK